MLIQKSERRWETRPLDCWDKAKELRKMFYQDEKTAHANGVFLIEGGAEGADSAMMAGIGNCHLILSQPTGASIGNVGDEFARQCRGVTEAAGYGRDMCGYMQNYIGSMLSNRHFLGGEFPPRDMVTQSADWCNMFAKFPQLEAEYWDVPQHYMDAIGYYGPPDAERDEARMEYIVAQNMEAIEWLEKQTDQEFDDETYIETTKSSMRVMAMRGEVIEYLQTIPTPLDQKSLYSIFILGGLVKTQQEETEKFWKMLRDEIKWRAENHIGSVGTERYRWVENEPPPWFFLKYYRYMEEYGAVCIGSPYTHGTQLVEQPDGTWKRPKTPLEEGVPLNTREDIVRLKSRSRGSSGSTGGGHGPAHEQYARRVLNMYKAFKCNGAILPLHRAGIGCVFGMREIGVKMREMGIPFMHYETSHPGNRTDFSEGHLLDQLDTFMETQGLRRLQVETEKPRPEAEVEARFDADMVLGDDD
ncbi:2-hydroxyacyl-CoA dehydratase [Chloroflexota bacterium]